MRKRTLGMGIVLAALASLSLAVPAVARTTGAPGAAKKGLAGPAVRAAAANPGVLPPQSRPHGASYGQWGARWWQWLYQTPAESGTTQNQVLNNGTAAAPVPVNCALGQSGHVWFIGGALSPTNPGSAILNFEAHRTCSIPAGTFLFFPVINSEFDNLTSLCVTTPPTTFTADELMAAATGAINAIVPNTMTATIDGKSVSGLANSSSIFRAPSPRFSFTLPADNVGTAASGCPPSVVFKAGDMPPPPGATADGIYLMLAPLSPGVHNISFGGTVDIPASPPPALPLTPVVFTLEINYTITVVPRGHFSP